MSTWPTIVGSILAVFGMIFALQGQGILGPDQSFMVNNPRWITYGSLMVVLGISMNLVNSFTSKRKIVRA
jgi:hypothetical protein